MTELGPISRHYEAELRELARQHCVVVWLDKEGAYRELAAAMRVRSDAGEFPFPVRGFRGSFLELMLELDGFEDGIGMTPLIVHVPFHDADELRATPLLELYRAGRSHTHALPSLIKEAAHGRATTEQTQALLGDANLTLEKADRWLESLSTHGHDEGPDLSALSADGIFDDLMREGELSQKLAQPEVERAVWRRAELLLGITRGFRQRFAEAAAPASPRAIGAQEQVSNLIWEITTWALCVEFVHDLRRAPKDEWLLPLAKLPKPAVQACQRLAVHIRERHVGRYTDLADEIERQLVNELADASAEDLGQVDTFRFEDSKVLAAALESLARADYRAVHDWAVARMESFWAREAMPRKLGWQLVLMAASLGLALTEQARLLEGVKSHADAVERYAQRGYRVDAAHRRLEQARQQASVLELEEFAALRQRLDGMREAYRAWADTQAIAFNTLCSAQGFLPSANLRQRELFEEVVRPWTQEEGVTAYFTVDALRYEMGEQLYEALAKTRTADVILKARLAELPTVTEVGMNVLAPLSLNGKLRPDFDKKDISGFRSQQARVSSPEDRRKVMHERVGGKTCPKISLEDVLADDVTKLRRRIAEAKLVIVHSEGIDKAGEKGVGLIVFEQELQNLRAAWRQLYDAGVRRFVFTADHGFLLHDPVTRAPRAHGFKTDPKRRHVVSKDYLVRDGKIAVRASDLEYDCEDVCFLFPEDAAPFDIGEKAKDFVHGGNSLQERVIPVLTVQHRHAPGAETVRYLLDAEVGKPLARMHCLSVSVRLEKGHTLSFSSVREMELVLSCEDDPSVQVELCDAREARVTGNAVIATVEQRFDLYFRLRGTSERRVLVTIKHATGQAVVTALTIPTRFDVELAAGSVRPPPASVKPKATNKDEQWLKALPEGGVRDVLRHIAVHGSINEAEATKMLGGGRQFRQFSRELDDHMKVVPFRVHTDTSSGTKCYVRGEG